MPDHWLIPPRTRSRGIPRRGAPPHLATLFEGFTAHLTVERQCRPGTLATYRWCFADFLHFAERNPRTPVVGHRLERGWSITTIPTPTHTHSAGTHPLDSTKTEKTVAPTGSDGAWSFVIEEFVPLAA